MEFFFYGFKVRKVLFQHFNFIALQGVQALERFDFILIILQNTFLIFIILFLALNDPGHLIFKLLE